MAKMKEFLLLKRKEAEGVLSDVSWRLLTAFRNFAAICFFT